MATDPKYAAALSLAKDHLTQAFEAFRTDPRILWPELHGTVSKAQAQVWVDALKDALEHHRQIEGLLSWMPAYGAGRAMKLLRVVAPLCSRSR